MDTISNNIVVNLFLTYITLSYMNIQMLNDVTLLSFSLVDSILPYSFKINQFVKFIMPEKRNVCNGCMIM